MNLYGHELSLLDFNIGYSDHLDGSFSSFRGLSSFSYTEAPPDNDAGDNDNKSSASKPAAMHNPSPPRHRHDGKSPLPLGIDWSPPPRKWDGQNSLWPHDPHTGWSYCVTIPSWIFLPDSRGSNPIVFYRVQIGIQSPEAVTTTRGILRRFRDFLSLYSELKGAFPQKKLPPAPPRKILRLKSRMLLEERRCSLEDWMENMLSNIDLSRSFQVATFLELEAAVRSSFNGESQQVLDTDSSASGAVPSVLFKQTSDVSLLTGGSSFASDYGNDTCCDTSELGSPSHGNDKSAELGMENSTLNQDSFLTIEQIVKYGMPNNSRVKSVSGNGRELLSELEIEKCKLDGHLRRLSTDSLRSDLSSVQGTEISNLGAVELEYPGVSAVTRTMNSAVSSGVPLPKEILVALPSEEQHKLNRVLINVQQRLATAKTDMEDLIARLNQELAVRQFLTAKVKDLEAELETSTLSNKENMQQAVLTERERFTQMQWDMEELRKKCLEMEFKLISEQDEKLRAESEKFSIAQDNEMLSDELYLAQELLKNSQKHYEESEVKSKADLKLLVKEVKSLRSSQSELKLELSRVMKEKNEIERVLQKEKQIKEHANTANAKLLHECAILRNRLQECSVNFLSEEEDRLVVDTSSPSDAMDLLTTSDNRIGLLLAEAQLLAQDVENTITMVDENHIARAGDETSDSELRKMLTDVFVDNARLRKQVNSVIRCVLNTSVESQREEEREEMPTRKTVFSRFM